VAAAQGEADAIDRIAKTADLSFLASGGIPCDVLLQIAHHVVLARIAQYEGDDTRAVAEFQEAVKLEDGLPYMEPPFWYYPVRQSLGAALLKSGQAQEAVAAFEASLKHAPNNGWAIFGLMEAQKKLGDEAGAMASEAALAKAWIGPRELLDLSKL
jgi:tetratricopeptide (TPR) repeat protein